MNRDILLHWSASNNLDKMDIEFRRDSFCGKLSVCNNLYQYGIKFTNTSTHTYPIGSKEFSDDIDHFGKCIETIRERAINVKEVDYGGLNEKPELWNNYYGWKEKMKDIDEKYGKKKKNVK